MTIAIFSTILYGYVGSIGECLRWRGVSEKRALMSIVEADFFRCLRQAVQLVIILPCITHLSVVCSLAQYKHINFALKYLVM